MLFVNISNIFLSLCQRAVYQVSTSRWVALNTNINSAFLSFSILFDTLHNFPIPLKILNTSTPHFYPFQFSGIKYLLAGFCAGVWIFVDFGQIHSCLQRRRFSKKYFSVLFTNIKCVGSKKCVTRKRTTTFLRVLRTCDLESQQCLPPSELDEGRFFFFCPS